MCHVAFTLRSQGRPQYGRTAENIVFPDTMFDGDLPFFADAALHLGVFIFGRNKLTTAKIEAARAAGAIDVAAEPVTT